MPNPSIMDLDILAEATATADRADLKRIVADLDALIAKAGLGKDYPLDLVMEREIVKRQIDGNVDFEELVAEFFHIWEPAVAEMWGPKASGHIAIHVLSSIWIGAFRDGTLIGLSYVPRDGIVNLAKSAISLLNRIDAEPA